MKTFENKPKSTTPTKVVNCVDCGKTFSISGEEQDFFASKGFALPTRCPDTKSENGSIIRVGCRTKKKGEKNTCKDCGKTFFITKEEAEYFVSKQLAKPCRCKACREERKNKKKSS